MFLKMHGFLVLLLGNSENTTCNDQGFNNFSVCGIPPTPRQGEEQVGSGKIQGRASGLMTKEGIDDHVLSHHCHLGGDRGTRLKAKEG